MNAARGDTRSVVTTGTKTAEVARGDDDDDDKLSHKSLMTLSLRLHVWFE